MFKSYYIKALDDYRKARRGASIQELLARLTGNFDETGLYSYDEVRRQLQAIEKSTEHLEEIPLDAIVGSVGRYQDFTRKYLPKSSINEDRWARVMASSQDLSGLPPIDVYKIGEVYFVRDGNHRVSVARQLDNKTIQAYVTNVETKVNLTPGFTPDDLIIKAEQVKFLENTKLDLTIPNSDLSATKAGAYPTLLEHIEVHRYYLGLEKQQEIPYEEAAANWYKNVFLPVVSIIKKRDLLCDFPDRTVTDLYLWAADHRASLEEQVGWDIGAEAALSDLSEMYGSKRKSLLGLLSKVINWMIPNALGKGPPAGTWREKLDQMSVLEHLFNDLIVAMDDSANAWKALDQAIILAKLENSSIHGVHIHANIIEKKQSDHSSLEDAFSAHCMNAGISDFDLIVAAGDISDVLCEHSRYADIIFLPLNHPPGDEPIKRLGSGITSLIRNCSVPILTVPAEPRPLERILLAYDGSIKAQEALFIAAYLGAQHGSTVMVLTSAIGVSNPDPIQEEARNYLDRFPLNAQYIISNVPVSEQISMMHQSDDIDLILIGGYSGNTLIDIMLGSVVDKVMREIQLPILICR